MKRTSLYLLVSGAILCSVLTACTSNQETKSKVVNGPAQTAPQHSPEQWPVLKSAITKDPVIEKRIDELLARMTLEEKIGQVIQPEINEVTPEEIKQYHIGSVLNGGGGTPYRNKYAPLQDWIKMADSFYNASVDKSNGRTGIPIMWGTDAVHGMNNVIGATLFPHNIGLGATNNPELLKKIGWATARELSVTGLDWDFSPTVAVARDDRWGRTYESWSEDPRIVNAFAREMIKGLQGEPGKALFNNQQVIATTKHYIGDGGTLNGVDRGATQGDEQHLRDIHGAGYFSAIESGVQVVMASFSSYQGMPMHGHKYLLTDVLKNRMGFDGLVVGDWNGHMFIPGCTVVNCPQSLMAGLDIYMVPDPQWKELYKNLLAQAKSGEITADRLNDAVRRILRVKIRAGLFEKGAPSTRELAGKKEVLGAPEHREIARQAVRESLVLLKNKNNLLPLKRNQKVLVAGDGADNIGKQSGGWSVSWQGTGNTNADFPGATSIYAGINKIVSAAGGKTILSVDGSYKEKPDVAIVVFGEDPYAEMQGDLGDLSYKPRNTADWELLKKLRSQHIPVVSLFISGRPLWVNREINASDAFVAAWLPGTEGQGIADVIFRNPQGKINYDMKGRLSFSWPKHPTQSPLNVGDKNYDPLFAYGYGLSYSDKDTLGDNLSEEGIKAESVVDQLDLFNRRPIGEWQLEIIGFQNDRIPMTSKSAKASSLQISAVDRNVQEDARRVEWNGQGAGQVAFSVSDRKDFTNYVTANTALVFEIKVDAAPTKTTFLRLGCGSFCASDINVTEKLKSFAGKSWQTVTVPLSCFPNSGANFGVNQPTSEYWTQVLQPFSLLTDGKLDITFSKVSLVKGAGKNAVCP
ncbi:MAG TPA: glycoside hydrolase family 3 N-terminal domain-containing protein [Cellvibrio sp.]